jgi:hypothetical protein
MMGVSPASNVFQQTAAPNPFESPAMCTTSGAVVFDSGHERALARRQLATLGFLGQRIYIGFHAVGWDSLRLDILVGWRRDQALYFADFGLPVTRH